MKYLFSLLFVLSLNLSLQAQLDIKKLNDKAAFEQAINNHKKVVVFFAAEWCDYCRAFLPQVAQLAPHYQDIQFFQIDYDENTAFFEEEGIEATPTTKLYQKGVEVAKIVVIETQALEEELQGL